MNSFESPSLTPKNPIFQGWYADPEIHRFGHRYYIYPTFSAEYDRQTFFEVWSSGDLRSWRNEGVILDLADVAWSTNRAAWAPTVVERDRAFYMYFSAGDGAGIGVAKAESPTGPFRDLLGRPLIAEYHFGAQPIDAHAFCDDDGRCYLYYGGWRHAVVVELAADMASFIGAFQEITPEDYVEGPFMLKRQGTYYFMWSEGSWGDPTYGVAYARAPSPHGPFERIGTILRGNAEIGTSAGHHSILQIPERGETWIAYHRRPPGETNRHHRVVCLDRLYFDDEGNILPVVLT